MAKAKVKSQPIEPIRNLWGVDKLTVQKSKPLFALWRSDLTLAEFKILDTYLGRINSHDIDHRTVKFEKGEFEKLLGVKQLKVQVLDERLKHLMTTVTIPDKDDERGFCIIALFEKAHVKQDEYGIFEIELTCTESAKKYIFNVEELSYLRYKLKNIINIKSRYSYILFLYLLENRFRGTWEISLEELKSLLNCSNEDYCKQFKVFNDRVLKRVHKEICAVTDVDFDYQTIKKGRSVVGLKFIYKASKVLSDDEQLSIDDIDVGNYVLWHQPLKPLNLTIEELEEIDSVLMTVPINKMPNSPACEDSEDLMKYHYLDMKVKEINRRNASKRIDNKYAYLLKMIKQDIE